MSVSFRNSNRSSAGRSMVRAALSHSIEVARACAWRRLTAGLALLLTLSPLAYAFDALDTVKQAIPDARLAGAGSLTWFGFHVYDAHFYVSQAGFSSQKMTREPFALDLDYAHAFSGQKIAEKGREEMDDMGIATKQQAAEWEKQMARIYPDVKPGDHLIGLFVPGKGTTFYLNDKLLGAMPGDEFAHAFFAVWFDAQTPAPKLRTALLAGAAQ